MPAPPAIEPHPPPTGRLLGFLLVVVAPTIMFFRIREERDAAVAARERAEQARYGANILAAELSWRAGEIPEAKRLLRECHEPLLRMIDEL